MYPSSCRIDPDFSREVLEELYTYRRKRPAVAWLLWATLGWLGAHRFYLERPFTGLAMLLTGGGGLLWWLVDGGLVRGMVRIHNAEQAIRERRGLPPLEMDFMPPLRDEALRRTPAWVERWGERGRGWRRIRLGGDILVLLVAGLGLGAMARANGALEAVVAVVLLAIMTSLGAGPAWLDDLPAFHALVRWTHRLRLFYYHNRPGSPVALLLRSGLGILWAPFRARDRAEVRLYVELGAVFTGIFLLLDAVPGILLPLLSPSRSVHLGTFVASQLAEGITTFFLTYAFAAPVGGILTLYILVRPTHTLPRVLAVLTIVAVSLGMLAALRS